MQGVFIALLLKMVGWVSDLSHAAKLLEKNMLLIATLFMLSFVQTVDPIGDEQELLRKVMPRADTFSMKKGTPPVVKGYRTDSKSGKQTLVGYVFLTSDIPPEEMAYSGTIEVLIGMNLKGELTGIRVVRHREAISRIIGDFLRFPGFQEQFTGKHISDPFRVGRDVDGITRATISIRAMSRSVRNAARRVADVYLSEQLQDFPAGTEANATEQLKYFSWREMLSSGLITKIIVSRDNQAGLNLSFVYIGDETLGRLLLGPRTYAKAKKGADARAINHHLMLVGIEGTYLNLFQPERLSIQQGKKTFPISSNAFILLGEPGEGKIAGQVAYVGVLLIDRAVDITQPFTILNDLRPEIGLFSGEYSPPVDEQSLVQKHLDSGGYSTPVDEQSFVQKRLDSGGYSTPVDEQSLVQKRLDSDGAPSARNTSSQKLAPSYFEEETALSRLFTDIPWINILALLSLFGLVIYAFLRKSTRARWIALAYTLVYLGFIDGGFLSISHITSGFKVGPRFYLNELPLLLVVGFTLITILLWGRLFCGSLCPFGALQDFLEKVVPRRFQRTLPQRIHDKALYIKYGILLLILPTALIASDTSIYQYFEPFGTIFFLSPSFLLWGILIIILAASAIIPRFYCRYLCPLGAALGLASLLTIFRIKRVEQCKICKVCEHHCPTAAIRGLKIDFKECVRCDICETKLITRAGVCNHTIDKIRVRLKSLSTNK